MKRILPGLIVGLALLPSAAEAQCTYNVNQLLSFGSIRGVPTPEIDVTTTIQVNCPSSLLSRRVCLSLPVGTGGISLTDRRMVSGSHFVQFQVYRNAARTQIWGLLGGQFPPHPVDFPPLTTTQTATVYGRVFANQTEKAVGTYESNLTPIEARSSTFLVIPPDCTELMVNQQSVPPILAQLTIETSCTVGANPLDFGTVTGMTGHAATSNLAVTCTVDGPYTIALDGGSVGGDINDRRMQLGPGPETIAYQLYQDPGHTQIWGDTPETVVEGTGTGSPQSIPVFGLVPAQDPKPPGTYQDVITVTVEF